MLQAAARLPLDGMLFYFRNEKQGGCPRSCDPKLLANCSGVWPALGCLDGTCADRTAANVAGEVADARAALDAMGGGGPRLPLHVGVYVTAHEPTGAYNCAAPSATYGRLVLEAALRLAGVAGAMAYRMQTTATPQRTAVATVFYGYDRRCPVATPFAYTATPNSSVFCCDSTEGFPRRCASAVECCLVPGPVPPGCGAVKACPPR